MKISLITVTYNSEKYLEECIVSVIRQNYKNIEHIIIDGQSADSTVSIIERYSSNISHWISEKDNGIYHAINKGMRLATGDIIGLLNSDDVLASSDVISTIVNCFTANKIDSLYGDLVYVDQYNIDKVVRTWRGQNYKRDRFKYGWMPAHPTFYFKRELVDQFGAYESHYFTAADYELMTRYLFLHKVSSFYLPKLIVRMRMGGASNGSIYLRLRANRRDYLAMKKNSIPFPLVASILKPARKIPQYYESLLYKLFKKKTNSKAALKNLTLSTAEKNIGNLSASPMELQETF
jgi:glycosyltransferase involved in cell wall biosynthesis